jgi:hypothetical protein
MRTHSPIDVVLVSAPACHFCDDAQVLLEQLSQRFELRVRKVDMLSDEGRALAVSHRMPFPPLLLIGGAYFGHGRISQRKLEQYLATLNIAVEVN